MKKLNYKKLMAADPTVYTTITNERGQQFDLVEHPQEGEDCQVIIVYHAEKVAFISDFWDTADMESNGDYTPVYVDGQMLCNFQLA